MKRYFKKNQKGFTLIEIIAVLIILGILAAVAATKFMNLTQDAQLKALQGAVAEGLSTCNLCFGKKALELGTTPSTSDVLSCAVANPPASDDFSYTFATGSDILVTVGHKGTSWGTATGQWVNPD